MVYKRMPFGLKNASAKFQRVMDAEVSRSGCSEFAFAYIDDLLIASGQLGGTHGTCGKGPPDARGR